MLKDFKFLWNANLNHSHGLENHNVFKSTSRLFIVLVVLIDCDPYWATLEYFSQNSIDVLWNWLTFHLYFDAKSQICIRILTNHRFFMGNFKIAMIIYENHRCSKENQRCERESLENHRFFKGKLTLGRNRQGRKHRQKSRTCDRGTPNCQKWCFRLTFFRLFWDSPQRNDRF